jgi:transposase
MSAIFRSVDRRQPYLFPESIDDWLPDDHLARFVVEVTESLDISALQDAYKGCGKQPYDPKMLLALLFYGYATGVFSSRKLEKATHDSVAFRFISVNEHPDHDTISNFRSRFLPELRPLFVQILQIAQEAGLLKLGTISLDGTKIKANASKHSALSYEYACKIEEQLKKEVEELFRMAEASDTEPLPEGMNIPEELKRRDERLKIIAEAKKEIERRAEERYKAELAEYERKMESRKEKAEQTGKKPRGRVPAKPEEGAGAREQVNLTDADSRIMPQSGGGFEQSYNAQACVTEETLMIAAAEVSQNTNDKREMEPMLEELKALPDGLGEVSKILADAGYYSEANVEKCEEKGIEPYISPSREEHNRSLEARIEEARGDSSEGARVSEETLPGETGELPESQKASEKMRARLNTPEGRKLYGRRKCTVEPVFGVIKAVLGFRQFLLRGLEKVRGEWSLVCLAWNLKRLHTLKCNKV